MALWTQDHVGAQNTGTVVEIQQIPQTPECEGTLVTEDGQRLMFNCPQHLQLSPDDIVSYEIPGDRSFSPLTHVDNVAVQRFAGVRVRGIIRQQDSALQVETYYRGSLKTFRITERHNTNPSEPFQAGILVEFTPRKKRGRELYLGTRIRVSRESASTIIGRIPREHFAAQGKPSVKKLRSKRLEQELQSQYRGLKDKVMAKQRSFIKDPFNVPEITEAIRRLFNKKPRPNSSRARGLSPHQINEIEGLQHRVLYLVCQECILKFLLQHVAVPEWWLTIPELQQYYSYECLVQCVRQYLRLRSDGRKKSTRESVFLLINEIRSIKFDARRPDDLPDHPAELRTDSSSSSFSFSQSFSSNDSLLAADKERFRKKVTRRTFSPMSSYSITRASSPSLSLGLEDEKQREEVELAVQRRELDMVNQKIRQMENRLEEQARTHENQRCRDQSLHDDLVQDVRRTLDDESERLRNAFEKERRQQRSADEFRSELQSVTMDPDALMQFVEDVQLRRDAIRKELDTFEKLYIDLHTRIFECREKENECVVCLDDDSSYAAVPCGHLCVCLQCSSYMATCPICRANVEMFVPIIG